MAGVLLAACDGGETTSGGQGGGGGEGGSTPTTSGSTSSSTSSTTTSSTSSSTTSTTTTETIPGCAGGQDLLFGEIVEGNLAKDGQADYYRFDGLKGQVLYFDINAQEIDGVTFDPTYVDTVITLYDKDEKRIAQNNNPFEYNSSDSVLYTILPEDGSYCIRVTDCNNVLSSSSCTSDPARISTTFYELTALEFIDDGPGDFFTADPEAGDDPPSAAEIDLQPTQSGGYFGYLWGYYEDTSDVDVFTFTLPDDVDVPFGSRSHWSITAFPADTTGSGSTIPTGELVIYDPDDPTLPIARIDPSKSNDFQVPLQLSKEYWLFVNRPAGTKEENDFYFLAAVASWGNPLEVDDVTNSDPATPEVLSFSDADSAFIEGDLTPITDLDHYEVDVPGNNTLVTAVCAARTRGSGLRGMKISILGENGQLLSPAATDNETSTQLAIVQDIPVGANNSVILKIEAAMQADDASSSYYQCGIHFSQ